MEKPRIVCPNCGRVLGCGCQKKTAQSGKACCIYCVKSENLEYLKLKSSKPRKYLP